ncbi:MAG: RsiV family protein [Muribaculaceae bacterium]|nr:RsiV family protein [Muribaculaceae bacterium]
MKLKYILSMAALVALMASCSKGSGEGTDENADSTNSMVNSGESYTFTKMTASRSVSLEGTADDYGMQSDAIYTDSVSLMMPVSMGKADVGPLQNAILNKAFGMTGGDAMEVMTNFMKQDADSLGYTVKEVTTVSLLESQGYNLVSGQVVYLSGNWMSYCVSGEQYYPAAAHGMPFKQYVNYSLTDNRVMNLADVIEPSKNADLLKSIQDRAKEMEDAIGPTSITELPSDGNFYLNSDSELVFVYQPYEVASYAQGFISIPLYPYEISQCLTPAAKTMFNLN